MPNQITPQDRADIVRRIITEALLIAVACIIAAAVFMTVAGCLEGLPV